MQHALGQLLNLAQVAKVRACPGVEPERHVDVWQAPPAQATGEWQTKLSACTGRGEGGADGTWIAERATAASKAKIIKSIALR